MKEEKLREGIREIGGDITPRPERAQASERVSPVMCSSAEQEQLFNDILFMKTRIQNLASYVQNDFERGIEEGHFDKDNIDCMMSDMEKDFGKVIDELTELKIRCNKVMRHYCT